MNTNSTQGNQLKTEADWIDFWVADREAQRRKMQELMTQESPSVDDGEYGELFRRMLLGVGGDK